MISFKKVVIGTGIVFVLFILGFTPWLNQVEALSTGLDPNKMKFQMVASGLNQPLLLTNAGDGSGRAFIVERAGRILVLKKGSVLPTPFLDIHLIVNSSGDEQGLLALAFHPAYESNGKFYIVYTNQNNTLVLSQFTRSGTNPDQANPGSQIQLLTIAHPTFQNHNGGTLAFGPDGYLYWSTGDGGSGGDPNNNGQNLGSLLGKILRLNVNAAPPYSIPPSNPFYNNPSPSVRKEIWAYGLRNPWRISFDRLTGDLWIADVGQNRREEIDFQVAGGAGGENYGWRVMEGSLCYLPSSGCDPSGKVLPVTEYDHSVGCSVTGGYRYRGSNYPSLSGHYFYADLCSGILFDLYRNAQNSWVSSQLSDTPYVVSSFGESETGELYLIDYNAGKVYQIQYQEAVAAPSHDDIDNARDINSIPYNDLDVNTSVATTAIDDPTVPECTLTQGLASVWYRYTPSIDQTIYIDTSGSNFDTWIAAWTGARGNLTAVGCNDDVGNTVQSALGLSLTGGQTYYFEVAQFNGDLQTGGVLDFHIRSAQKVDILIANNLQDHYFLPGNDVLTVNYQDILDGPVKVIDTDGQDIFASQRAFYGNSFNELMGYPAEQFTTEYWFPWYDQVNLSTWILVGNPSSSQIAYVEIYIGGIKQGSTISIPPNGRMTPQYPGVLNGPVRVLSVSGPGTPTPLNIFASERSIYASSFNEVMGYPADKITTEYWFPWYDQVNMSTWILAGNPSTTQTAYVDIYVGGVKRNDTDGGVPYAIPPSGRITPQFAGLVDGPVQVVSVTGAGTPTPINIFASERSIYASSFNEVMGFPVGQFTTEYYYTWYENTGMATWILAGNPSDTQTAYVDIYIGGVKRNDTIGGVPYSIPPNGRITPQFNLNTGPVRVVSVTGPGTPTPINIFTSERSIYASSFNEMMGYPANQLASEYWFTWYDSVWMNTDLLVSKP